MTFEQYQKAAYRAIQEHASNKEEVMHWAIGLGEEAGEALSVVKHKYYGGRYDIEDIVGELGDVLWHVAALCTALNIDMNSVAKYNVAKLEHRYPTGTFDFDRSVARHAVDGDFKDSPIRERIMNNINLKEE